MPSPNILLITALLVSTIPRSSADKSTYGDFRRAPPPATPFFSFELNIADPDDQVPLESFILSLSDPSFSSSDAAARVAEELSHLKGSLPIDFDAMMRAIEANFAERLDVIHEILHPPSPRADLLMFTLSSDTALAVPFYATDNPAIALRRVSEGQDPELLGTLYAKLQVAVNDLLPGKVCEALGHARGGPECRAIASASCKRRKSTFPGYELVSETLLTKEENLALLFRHARFAGPHAVCVETGTYMGDTTLELRREEGICGGGVVTIELGEELAAAARERFEKEGFGDIRLLQGDSQVAIRELGEERGAGGEFWYLDGHYSMLDTACGADASPILGELEFILGGRRGGLRSQDVIVIDDARTFRGDRLANNMWCPELASIQDRVCELDPGLLFYVEDDAAVVRRPTELERGWEEGELVWNVEGVGREAEGWRYKWEV